MIGQEKKTTLQFTIPATEAAVQQGPTSQSREFNSGHSPYPVLFERAFFLWVLQCRNVPTRVEGQKRKEKEQEKCEALNRPIMAQPLSNDLAAIRWALFTRIVSWPKTLNSLVDHER